MKIETLFMYGVIALVTAIVTAGFIETGWTDDCRKLGAHVTVSGDVYKCEAQK